MEQASQATQSISPFVVLWYEFTFLNISLFNTFIVGSTAPT